jgi:hypothetical protein
MTVLGRRIVCSAAVVASMLVVRATHAAPSTSKEADALIEEGVSLRVKGKNQEALELFRKAHALAPTARTLAQVGLAEGALQQWIDAEDHLSAALAAHDTPWIENQRNREALERALTSIRGHVGRVAVLGPAGADISVNGRPAGRLPLSEPLRVAEGAVQIEAKAPGRRSASSRIDATGGSTVTVNVELPVLSPPPAPAPVSMPSPLVRVETSGPRWKSWTGVSLLGVSAAALATGIVWLAIDGNMTCSAPSGTVCQHLYDTKTQGWLAIAAGAAAGVGGGLLLWQGHDRRATVGLGPAALRFAADF